MQRSRRDAQNKRNQYSPIESKPAFRITDCGEKDNFSILHRQKQYKC